MELHQLLRFIGDNVPIRILDIQGIEICKVFSKKDINVDLYEYNILKIGLYKYMWNNETYLDIILQK